MHRKLLIFTLGAGSLRRKNLQLVPTTGILESTELVERLFAIFKLDVLLQRLDVVTSQGLPNQALSVYFAIL